MFLSPFEPLVAVSYRAKSGHGRKGEGKIPLGAFAGTAKFASALVLVGGYSPEPVAAHAILLTVASPLTSVESVCFFPLLATKHL